MIIKLSVGCWVIHENTNASWEPSLQTIKNVTHLILHSENLLQQGYLLFKLTIILEKTNKWNQSNKNRTHCSTQLAKQFTRVVKTCSVNNSGLTSARRPRSQCSLSFRARLGANPGNEVAGAELLSSDSWLFMVVSPTKAQNWYCESKFWACGAGSKREKEPNPPPPNSLAPEAWAARADGLISKPSVKKVSNLSWELPWSILLMSLTDSLKLKYFSEVTT